MKTTGDQLDSDSACTVQYTGIVRLGKHRDGRSYDDSGRSKLEWHRSCLRCIVKRATVDYSNQILTILVALVRRLYGFTVIGIE